MPGNVVLDTVADHNVQSTSQQCVQKRSVEEVIIVALLKFAMTVHARVQVEIELEEDLELQLCSCCPQHSDHRSESFVILKTALSSVPCSQVDVLPRCHQCRRAWGCLR